MKISSNCFGLSKLFHRKMIKSMKLTVFVFLAICLQVSASGHSQKITLNMQNVTIEKVFQEIKKQTGFLVLYNNNELKKIGNINVKVKDVDVLDALERSLSNTGLTFKIIDKTIVLNPIKTISTLIKTDPISVEIEVKGRVINEKGEPLEGVTISLKGGKQITATNANGDFKLNIEDPNATLFISAITIEPIDFKLNGRTNLTITVKTKTSILEDVSVSSVNTGYQTISRERSAGAFSKPNQTMIQDRSSSANLLQRLEGLVPGFAINLSQGSTPTGSNRMQTGEGNSNQYIIRGIGSVQSDRAPLYVVNGIILDDLSSLNANDVEDVTVLKDATASSIWGSRAANGVVVITTKKGRSNDKIKVQYDAFYNMLGKPDFLSFPRMTSAQFIKTAKEVFDPVTNLWSSVSAFSNATSGGGVPPHEVILYNQNRGLITASQANAQLDSLSKIYNGNQIGDYFYRNQALMNQTVSLSGGSKNYNFYGSFSYINNQSYIPGEKNNQYTVNLRQDLNVSNRVKLFLITDLSNSISSTKRTILTDNRFLPYQLFKDNNGNSTDMSYLTYITTDSIKKVFERKSLINLNYNPIDEFNRGETNKNGVLARVTGGLSLKLLKGLKFEGTYGYALGNNKSTDYDAESSFLTRSTLVKFTQEAVLPSTIPTYFLPKTGGQLSTYNSMQKNWTVRNQLVFDTGFNGRKHQITILVGQEAKQSFSNNSNSVIRGYDPLLLTFQNIDYNTLALTGVTNPVVANNTGNKSVLSSAMYTESELTTRNSSYYTNAGYTFKSKYTLNGSWRIDESNLFGIDKSAQRKPVWSIGTKWQISGESFMNKIDWVSSLAVRATYGITGNAPVPGSATSYDVLTAASSSFAPGPGLNISTYANRALTWERTENLNLGIDYSLFKRKMYGSIDYYERKTTDLIGQLPTNFLAGASSIVGNYGDMNNKGIEISITTVNISTKNFTWQTTLNLGYNINKITKLVQISAITDLSKLVQQTKYYAGYPALSIFAYNWAGLDTLGDPQIYMPDGTKYKGASTTNLSIDGANYMGSFQPVWNGGLLNFIAYKNFSISSSIIFNLGYYGRRDVSQKFNGRITPLNLSMGYSQGSYPQLQSGNLHSDLLYRWLQKGDEAITDIPSYINANTNRRNIAYYFYGSNNVYDASYIKMRDITFSYTLPKTILKKLKADEIRFKIQVNNLMLWKANKYDIDPEFQISDINYTLDRSMQVGQGAIAVGLNVKF